MLLLDKSTGSVATAILGATDTFEGRSMTAYKNWLATVQPTAATHEYATFINKKVADQADGVWTTGTVQCLHQGNMRVGHSALHDAHIASQQQLAQQKSAFDDCVGR
jgi:hypothetical protein